MPMKFCEGKFRIMQYFEISAPSIYRQQTVTLYELSFYNLKFCKQTNRKLGNLQRTPLGNFVHNIIVYIFMNFGILLKEHNSQKVQWYMLIVKECNLLSK